MCHKLRSQAVVTRVLGGGQTTRYERRFNDGSLEVYGLALDPPTGTTRRWFLTQLKDAQGHTVTLNYNEAPYDADARACD
ncbi:MAG: hypothetical protein NZ585_08240 [Chloracidobacterium sp.]|nr:hypothetical protein [Chloracidobacterium sp.]MDW8218001.1 hypothetical protein [Acidobacteriota bacterium]